MTVNKKLVNNKGERTMSKPKKITIDEVEYVRADSVEQTAESVDGMQFAIVRTYDAGVHAGYIAEEKPGYIRLVRTRWLYEFYADNLFALAVEGSPTPEKCNYADEVPELRISENYSVIPMTPKGFESFKEVGPWRK